MASSAGSVASSANKQRGGGLPIDGQHHQHLSKCKRVCISLAEGKIKELTKLNPRGVYSDKTSPAKSPPVIKSQTPVLRENPKHPQPSPPNELVKLHQIVKKSSHIVQEGMHTLQAHTERNTNLLHKKAVALQMFGACISSGMGILESCKVAGIDTGFNDQIVWK